MFLADLEGHRLEEPVGRAIGELGDRCEMVEGAGQLSARRRLTRVSTGWAKIGAWLVCVALALCAIGCGVKPLGTNDASLVFRAEGDGAPGGPALASLVRARLAAAQVTADVTASGKIVTVTIDRDASDEVASLVAWRGGVALWETEAAAKAHDEKPLVDLTDAIAKVEDGGKSITLDLTPAGAARVAEARLAHAVVARDRTPLATIAPQGDALVVPLGDDLVAYARARALRQVLSSPLLPPMTRVSQEGVPTDVPLALSALAMPFLLSIAWLFFVRRFDRAQPEPWPIVTATFALGCFGIIPALGFEVAWTHVSQWTDPSLVTMGGRVWSLPIALVVFAS